MKRESKADKDLATAIHEAGHAIVARFMGVEIHDIEMADEGKPLADDEGRPEPHVAGRVVTTNYVNPQAEYWQPKNNADMMAMRYYKDRIEQMLPVSFAGVAAESLHTGGSLEALFASSGRKDNENIKTNLSILSRMGVEDAEVMAMRLDALEKAIGMVKHFYPEISAIAEILVRQRRLSSDEFDQHLYALVRKREDAGAE